jgi:hypothetical protein
MCVCIKMSYHIRHIWSHIVQPSPSTSAQSSPFTLWASLTDIWREVHILYSTDQVAVPTSACLHSGWGGARTPSPRRDGMRRASFTMSGHGTLKTTVSRARSMYRSLICACTHVHDMCITLVAHQPGSTNSSTAGVSLCPHVSTHPLTVLEANAHVSVARTAKLLKSYDLHNDSPDNIYTHTHLGAINRRHSFRKRVSFGSLACSVLFMPTPAHYAFH